MTNEEDEDENEETKMYEMKMYEMKNRISMTLKDPTLQQGFEIICKENAELRKDKEQLTKAKDNEVIELKEAVKQLTIILHEITFSEDISDYGCSSWGCVNCYCVSCKYNSSKLFKKIYEKYPELYENEETCLFLKEPAK